ncbi:hypothetical protein ACEV7S_22920 [Vibrio parahaemolyticus]|nr:hypothetical protein [Vibrio parahaemolyticus]
MKILSNFFDLVNSFFAILGVLVAIQSLKLRKSEVFPECESEVSDSLEQLMSKYNEEFRETELGKEIIASEFEFLSGKYNKEHVINRLSLTNGQSIIKIGLSDALSSLYARTHVAIFLFVFLPFIFSIVIGSIWNENASEVLLVGLILSLILLLLPWGIYKSNDIDANLVFSVVSFGKIDSISCYVRRNEIGTCDFTYHFHLRRFGIPFVFSKKYTDRTVKEGVVEYHLLVKHCSSKRFGYMKNDLAEKTVFNTVFTDLRFGWLRMVLVIFDTLKRIAMWFTFKKG